MLTRLFLPLFALSLALLVGCQSSSAPESAPAKVYDIRGKVVEVHKDTNKVKLDHEDIPGLMKAMKMDFAVEDPKVLDGISPGDAVEGKLKRDSGKYVLTELHKR